MLTIPSVQDAAVSGKRVLLHTDFDVPMKDGQVADDTRIRAAIPTIELLREKGAAKILIISKLGRPDGKVVESLRLAPVAARLAELTDTALVEVRENLRFDPREEANDLAFAKELAALGDIFVNEAFADSHRAHASIVLLPKLLPSFAGLRFEEEMRKLSVALAPSKNSLAIIGGAKFETKEPLLEKLASLYPKILLGGALGNDMLKARGLPVGSSLVSHTPVAVALAGNDLIIPPMDAVVGIEGSDAERNSLVNDVRARESILDIGSQTAEAWRQEIMRADLVLWNGPMGIYERGYTEGTHQLAQALAGATCQAVVGGGDTAAALNEFTFDPSRVFVSIGGGAMLEFLTSGTLPGIEALKVSAA